MKTVGIMTYHKYYNYGTVLQAYALQKKIELLGYDSWIINFKQDNSVTGMELLVLRIKSIGRYIKNVNKYITENNNKKELERKCKEFDDFYRDNIKIKGEYYRNTKDMCANPPIYDAYVVGSDQTWNPYASKGPEAYLLPFVKDGKKKGSYGPSVAVLSLTEEQQEKYKRLLSDFAFLSCREKTGAELLENLLGRYVKPVLDPTFLLKKEEWSELIKNQNDNTEPYILTYFLGEKKEHRKFVKQLRDKTGYKIISIPTAYLEMADDTVQKEWCGPDRFLELIKNATIVCTDSFHGMALSINMNKDFYSFCKTSHSETTSENSRITDVLEKFGLGKRLVELDTPVPDVLESIDYDKVNSILKREREDSESYLKNMLETMTK